jgi:hypothetical protein
MVALSKSEGLKPSGIVGETVLVSEGRAMPVSVSRTVKNPARSVCLDLIRTTSDERLPTSFLFPPCCTSGLSH